MTDQKTSKTPETSTKPDALQPAKTEPAKDRIADTDLDAVAGAGDDLTIQSRPWRHRDQNQ